MTERKETQQKKKYPIAVYLVIGLLGLLLMIIPLVTEAETLSAATLNLGTEFLGAVMIFFVLRYFLLEDNDISSSSDIDVKQLSLELSGMINRHNRQFLPATIYSSGNEFATKFNADLTHDLSSTSMYIFRGVSGKFVPARVRYSYHTISNLKVLLLDPTIKQNLFFRAKDRKLSSKYAEQTIEKIIQKLTVEIYQSTIALFDTRFICPSEVAYISGTSSFRLEMFDNNMYLALYHTTESKNNEFPEHIRYSKDSLYYMMYRIDTYRMFDLASKKVFFNSDSTEDDLIDHLKILGFTGDCEDLISKCRDDYKAIEQLVESGLDKSRPTGLAADAKRG